MKLKIRYKLLIGFTLLLLLSSLVQGIIFVITRQYVSSQIIDFQNVQAKKGATEIQKFFTGLSEDSYSLANTYETNPNDIAAAANYVLISSAYIKDIAILSPQGREIVKFDSTGQTPQDKLSYEIPSDSFSSAKNGTTAISKVYYTEIGLGPQLDLFSPIFGKKNQVIGIVKMQINLTLLKDDLTDIKLGDNGYVYVVDNNGRLIAHPSETYVLARPILTSRKIISDALSNKPIPSTDLYYVNEENIAVVAQAAKIAGYNWVAVFEQPVSEAFGYLDFIRNLFIITVAGASLFLLIIALLLSENLTRPIRKLQKSVQQIERGEIHKTVLIKSGDEIESLSNSFASLIDKLFERERSLQNITVQLEKANDKLKDLDKLKDEFVSVASHELRTPMTAIKSYLWMALQGRGGPLNERQKYYVERGYNSVDRLIRLVNDMLNISRIESGRITVELQAIDLLKLVQEVAEEVLPRAHELGVALTIDKEKELPRVLADPDKIKEVLFNLIGNSLKFTPRAGKVTIAFSQKDGFVSTKITDTGSGIEPEDISKLFQKFGLMAGSYTTNQAATGTGLGLYITRSIINIHEGKIWAESEGRGKGATFTFLLKEFTKDDEKRIKPPSGERTADSIGLIHSQI